MLTLGIDPGVSGALARVEGHNLLGVWRFPTTLVRVNGTLRPRLDVAQLVPLLCEHGAAHAVVETVNGIEGQSASASFTFGEATGVVLGILASLGIEPRRVTADVWSRGVGLPQGGGKNARRRHATLLFPAFARTFATEADDGCADAALIALYAQRLFGGANT